MNTCALCPQPAEVTVCRSCLRGFLRRLAGVGDVLAQLTITRGHGLTRPDTLGISRRSQDGALPVDLTAAQAATDLADVLRIWAHDLGGAPATGCEAAAWLIKHSDAVATHPDAAQCLDEITDAIHRAWQAVDHPPERSFLGPCPECAADLYARPGRAHVTCRCGAVLDAARRRDWLLSQVRDQLDTASGIARALPGLLSTHLTPAMIRGYAHRGRLAARPAGADGKPRYRIGDVLDVLGAG